MGVLFNDLPFVGFLGFWVFFKGKETFFFFLIHVPSLFFSLSFKNLCARIFLLQRRSIWFCQVTNEIFLPILLNVGVDFYPKYKVVAKF